MLYQNAKCERIIDSQFLFYYQTYQLTQMKQSKCYTCDKLTHNLLTANCSHKICFNCVKNNRNNHKCSYCSAMSASKNKIISGLSPARKQKIEKEKERDRERTVKTKSIETRRYEQSSPHIEKSTRRSQVHIQSCSNYLEGSTFEDPRQQIKLLCKQHHQPLTLFSKTSKQAICSICLCSKPKYNQDIMPIKGAESYLKKENQIQREESRVILNNIQKCEKGMRVNYEKFQLYYGSHVKVIEEIFAQLHQELQQKERVIKSRIDSFFLKKLRECQQIQQDLGYLIETLETYREQNKETNTLSESLYVYSSFKVIKKTMKTLNLDYVSYVNKNINLLQFNQTPYQSALSNLIKFNDQLPLKQEELISQSRRNRSASAHNVSAKKESLNSYSNRKKAYENVLNEKIGLGKHSHKQMPTTGNPHESSVKKSSAFSHSYNQAKHNNSLQSYINQNMQEQRGRHNNSTASYFNKSQARLAQQQPIMSSSNAFDYELKTPIKNLLTQHDKSPSSSKKKAEELEQQNGDFKVQEVDMRSYGKVLRRNEEFNAISTSSITSGLRMNEEEKALYKRLLKFRFTKTTYQQQQPQYNLNEQQTQTRDVQLQNNQDSVNRD